MKMTDRRRLLQFLALSGFSSTANAFWFFNSEKSEEEKLVDANQQIHKLKGTVKINDQTLSPSTIISPGDEIVTGENTEFVFQQGRDAYLLRSNTKMRLTGDNEVVDTLRIISGAVLSVFGSGRKNIITPTATVGIRGTGTYFEVEQDETYFCTCYGETVVSANTDPNVTESISTKHHESPRYIRNSTQGSYIEKAPVKNHTDAELIMLEATVGREPPFGTGYDPDADYVG
jgi:hypothetical protein